MNSQVTFSHGTFHIDVQVLRNQQELTFNSSVRTQDVIWKTCLEQWMIGTNGEREREREKERVSEICVNSVTWW